mgnify:CR=1 FL=1
MTTLSEEVLDELKRLRGRTERQFSLAPRRHFCPTPPLVLILACKE